MADIALRLGSEVLVVQGSVGTQLMAQGFDADTPLPLLNLTEPETVLELERTYRSVGADCGVTNTFCATSSRLAAHGLAAQTAAINAEGVRLCREASFPHVLASVGPCGVVPEPGSGKAQVARPAADEAAAKAAGWPEMFGAAVEQYAEQVEALASAAPDAILLETFTNLDDAVAALTAATRACSLPVIASMCFTQAKGAPEPEEAARVLALAGAAVVGCNCMDVEATVEAVTRMRRATSLPIIARPSAGTPTPGRDGRPVYPAGPDAFADASVRLLRAGATLIGSCCGSGPAATGAISATVGGVTLG